MIQAAAIGGVLTTVAGPIIEGVIGGISDNIFSAGSEQTAGNSKATGTNDTVFGQLNQISDSGNIFSDLSDLASRPDDVSQGDLLQRQEQLYNQQQILSAITNMMKSLHDMAMSVINNLRL